MQAYKAIMKELRGWNKQRLIRAKMKKDLQKSINEQLIEIIEEDRADMDQMDGRFSHKEV